MNEIIEKKLRFEMNLRGTEKEVEDIKVRIATLTVFEAVISLYIRELK